MKSLLQPKPARGVDPQDLIDAIDASRAELDRAIRDRETASAARAAAQRNALHDIEDRPDLIEIVRNRWLHHPHVTALLKGRQRFDLPVGADAAVTADRETIQRYRGTAEKFRRMLNETLHPGHPGNRPQPARWTGEWRANHEGEGTNQKWPVSLTRRITLTLPWQRADETLHLARQPDTDEEFHIFHVRYESQDLGRSHEDDNIRVRRTEHPHNADDATLYAAAAAACEHRIRHTRNQGAPARMKRIRKFLMEECAMNEAEVRRVHQQFLASGLPGTRPLKLRMAEARERNAQKWEDECRKHWEEATERKGNVERNSSLSEATARKLKV